MNAGGHRNDLRQKGDRPRDQPREKVDVQPHLAAQHGQQKNQTDQDEHPVAFQPCQRPRQYIRQQADGDQAQALGEGVLAEHGKLDVLVKLLEPALMLVMAIIIGFLVVALLMPIFESNGLT